MPSAILPVVTALFPIFEFVIAPVPIFVVLTAPGAILAFVTFPFAISTVMTWPSTMSDENTVFAAYALSSGDATKAPAIKAATIIPPVFRLIIVSR